MVITIVKVPFARFNASGIVLFGGTKHYSGSRFSQGASSVTNLIVRIDLGVHGRLGPGKLVLLQKIDELGSISAAGRAMKMSYRQAWALVDQLNHAFQEPVVVSQTGGKSGGGAHLTDFGKLLLTHCNAVIGNAKKTAQPHLEFIDAVLSRDGGGGVFETHAKPQRKAKK